MRSLLAILFCLVGPLTATSMAGAMAWSAGDSWHISAMLFSGKEKQGNGIAGNALAGDAVKFDLHIVVLGVEKVEGYACYKLDFIIPGKKPPAGLTARYRVFVDADDGCLRKVLSFRDYKSIAIESFGKTRLLASSPAGFPVEVFPAKKMDGVRGSTSLLTASISTEKADGKRSARIEDFEGKTIEIRQTWVAGESWWRDYERYKDGQLELKAIRVDKKKFESIAKDNINEKEKTLLAKNDAPPSSIEAAREQLKHDSRLSAKVSLSAQKPRIKDLLEPMSAAAGLILVADDNVNDDEPVFAGVNWGNFPIHAAMEKIAESPVINGRWEKTEDGYRLLGWPRPVGSEAAKWKTAIVASVAANALLLVLDQANSPRFGEERS